MSRPTQQQSATLLKEVTLANFRIEVEEGGCFWLFLHRDDEVNSRCQKILSFFIQSRRSHINVLSININSDQLAEDLQVAFVPQVRLYTGGKEVRRLIGVPSGDKLESLWRDTLKIRT